MTCPTGATWFTATSASVDLKKNEVEYTRPDGQRARLSYAHLVLACGSDVNLDVVPAPLSFTMLL